MKKGTWVMISSPILVSIISRNLDFIILDREHGNFSDNDIFNCINAADIDCEVFVRPSSLNEAEILHALDNGADGIIAPHIEDELMACKLSNYCKFPPYGNRGFSPYVPSCKTKEHEKYKRSANDKIKIIGIIESRKAFDNIGAIEIYLDGIYLGVYDLSCDIGTTVNSNTIKQMCIKACKETSKDVFALYSDEQSKKFLEDIGVSHAVYKTDTWVLDDAMRNI
jgi:2-keto-3-deoxy-L-rhamnonate aldolase RhmA